MRDHLGPVEAAQVQTEFGSIYLTPTGTSGVHVNAPHLTVDGMPLSASAFLGNTSRLGFSMSNADNALQTRQALQARLVDGRVPDIVVFRKLAQVMVTAVRKFAEQNWALFLEAERRQLERQLEHDRSWLAAEERELASDLSKLAAEERELASDLSKLAAKQRELVSVNDERRQIEHQLERRDIEHRLEASRSKFAERARELAAVNEELTRLR